MKKDKAAKNTAADTAADTASAVGTAVRQTGIRALRAVMSRRQVILCALGAVLAALLLWRLAALLPRNAKPAVYRVGELELPSITKVVGYRQVLGMSESLTGTGRAQAGEYSYKAGKEPRADVDSYLELLQTDYGAVVEQDSGGPETGSLTVILPTQTPEKQAELCITYTADEYTLSVEEKPMPKEKPQKAEALVTPEQAQEILLTLTKAETGFKSDISVYTSTLEEETATVDGWEYYVFTVIADYSATRIEYRGTFYISTQDGVVLRYDKDADTTSRIQREE